MKNKPRILFLLLLLLPINLFSQQTLWTETFDVAEKGFWGGGSDMSGITKWNLNASACVLTTTNTYIKTVTTSGGRMEAKNTKGEAIWTSELIDISGHSKIDLSVAVSETGSLALTTKYVKVYYVLNGGAQTPFESNSQNIGDFGSTTATQSCLSGSNIQIIIKINSPNSTDATIFDNVTVKFDDSAPEALSVFAVSASTVKIQFSEQIRQAEAENIANYSISGIGNPISAVLGADQGSVQLNFSGSFNENQNYTIHISNIADKCGNANAQIIKSLIYIPFKLENIYNPSKNELLLEFTHALNKTTAENASNYIIDKGIGNPASAILVSDTSVHLIFTNSFANQTGYTISINNLIDNNGITIEPANANFTFHHLNAFDLVINEIMADPSPVVGLPESEYIEIYNKTAFDVCMWNWKLRIGETLKSIPLKILKANSYLLISSTAGAAALKNYGQSIGILGTTDLTNAGKEIALISNQSLKLDSVNYYDTWYQNSSKDDGGWSLERIDPDNTCGRESNWKASNDLSGGTPGKINSIDNHNIDNTKPKLLSIRAIAPNQIQMEFNEEIDHLGYSNFNNYLLDGTIKPKSVFLVENKLAQFTLVFETSFSLGKHNLKITGFNDICSNTASIDTIFTYYPGKKFDIVLNEILADNNPLPNALPNAKYIEIYNKTNENIDLSGWKLQIGDNFPISISNYIFGPQSYLIICPASQIINFQHFGNVLGILSESQLLTSGTSISLYNAQVLMIDTLTYSISWYHDAQKQNGGWSMERINPNNNCSRQSNWKASLHASGGTPGNINSVNSDYTDTISPKLISINASLQTQLQLSFNEKIDITSALNPGNYIIDGTINPKSAKVVEIETGTVNLIFESDFSLGKHSIQIKNMIDICSNTTAKIDTSFTYYPGAEFDILVNEIMVDINPLPNVLPPYKYIELYNKTDLDIDISGWTIQLGENAPIKVPEFVFNSHTHLIICPPAQVTVFETYGKALGILSESQLLIAGTTISVFNKQTDLIDYVKYSDSWYADEVKANGGWSLERIDNTNYCGGSQNWKASNDYKGGTPGQVNTAKASNSDISRPVLKRLTVLSSNKLALEFSKNISQLTAYELSNYVLDNNTNAFQQNSLTDTSRTTIILQFTTHFTDSKEQTLKIKNLKDFCGNILADTSVNFTYYLIFPSGIFAESCKIAHLIFSEEVDINSAQNTANYTITNGFGSPSKAYKHSERKNEVYLEFPDNFINKNSYTIHIENIKDLSGNSIKAIDLTFTYFYPTYNDIVINEILFNPKSNGFDFVEIYNKANNEVDLSKLIVANRDETGKISSQKVFATKNSMLPAGHFLAITNDTIQTKINYPAIAYDKFIQIPSMPSFSDDKGVVVLLFADSIIDEFAYADAMHFALITNTEGISLERIDPEKTTQVASNWVSAAESVGFATPANQNSQFRQPSSETSEEIKIEPETFSPNNDGFEDQLFIQYKFSEPGYVANVTVYDSKGLIITKIASNEMLGAAGTFNWDGLKEDNSKAKIGIYLIYFEIFNLKGEVKKYKKVCVLAGRLD